MDKALRESNLEAVNKLAEKVKGDVQFEVQKEQRSSNESAQLPKELQEEQDPDEESAQHERPQEVQRLPDATQEAPQHLEGCALTEAKDPKEMLPLLRTCADKLEEFAKATEEGRLSSRNSNEAYGEALQKAAHLLGMLGDAPSIAAALDSDQRAAMQYLIQEVDKADRLIEQLQ